MNDIFGNRIFKTINKLDFKRSKSHIIKNN
jgi:hypothetical protein